MKWLPYLAIVASMILSMTSCNKRTYIPVESRHSEVVLIKDTVVEIISNGEAYYNHTIDTTSLLQGNGVSSRASVTNGTLLHTLIVEPRRDSVAIHTKEVHIIDSIPYAIPIDEGNGDSSHKWEYLFVTLCLASQLTSIVLLIRHNSQHSADSRKKEKI